MEAISNSAARHFATYVLANKLRVGSVCIIAAALTWFAISLAPQSYEASALIEVNFQKSVSRADVPNAGGMQMDEYLGTQAMIVSSGDVVRSAIADVGAKRLYSVDPIEDFVGDAFASIGFPTFYKIDVAQLFTQKPPPQLQEALVNRVYSKVLASLSARPQPKTNLLKISFRNSNPEVAAQFVNVLVQKFLNRRIELASVANGASFMENEKLKYEREVAAASVKLATFSTKNDLYSADAQQTIILERRKDLQLKMADAVGKVSEREAEVSELTRQLMLLKLNTLAPQLALLAREGTYNAINKLSTHKPQGYDDAGPLPKNDPPLLLVRVYQDTAESLVKTNTDLIGLRELVAQQKSQLLGLDRELARLSSERIEFEALKRNVDLARRSAEAFATKAVEQRTELGLNQQKLASLQLVQAAIAPLSPSFPTPQIKLLLSMITSLLSVAGFAFAPLVGSWLRPSYPRARELAPLVQTAYRAPLPLNRPRVVQPTQLNAVDRRH